MASQSIINDKLLDRYQAIISRLAGDSSALKGWAITVSTAVVGFGAKDGPAHLAYLALVPLLLFYLLDAYYLACERACRTKYNEIARSVELESQVIDGHLVSAGLFLTAAFRPATWAIYLALAITAVAIGTGLVPLGTASKVIPLG